MTVNAYDSETDVIPTGIRSVGQGRYVVHYGPCGSDGKRYEVLYRFHDISAMSKFAAALTTTDMHYKTCAKYARRIVKAGLHSFLRTAWQPFIDSVDDLRRDHKPWRVPSNFCRQVRDIESGVATLMSGQSA